MCEGGGGEREGNHVLMSYEKSLGNSSSAFFDIKSQYKGIKQSCFSLRSVLGYTEAFIF